MNDKLQDKDGSQITCEKCKGSKFSGLKIYGNSKQVTTTGAQLLEKDKVVHPPNGKVSTIVLFEGELSGTYTVSCALEGDAQYPTRAALEIIVDGVSKFCIINSHTVVTGTITKIVCFAQKTYCDFTGTLHIMLNAGSAPLPWEPYTGGKPSPSPDYPQEIESVGMKWSTGANLLDISQWNVYEKTYGLTMMIDEDGYFQLEGTYDNGAGAGNIGKCMFRFMWTKVGTVFPDGVKFAGRMMKVSENVSNLYFLCTGLSENTPCLVISFSAVNGENIKIRFRPMLYVGDTAPEWEPYTGGVPKPYGDKIRVGVMGKNLLDPAYVYQNTISNYRMYKDGFLLKKGVTYTLSCYPSKADGLYIIDLSNYDKLLAVSYKKSFVTYTPNEDVMVTFNYYLDGKLDPKTSKLMLEIGENHNPAYEPYHAPQSMDIATPNGLPGIPVSSGGNYTDVDRQQWICDEVNFGRGVYVQRIAYTVVDGDKMIFKENGVYWNLPRYSSPGCVFSNYHINNFFSDNVFRSNDNHSFLFTTTNWMKKYFDTVDKLNEFCKSKYDAGTPLTLYYALTTPIETPLTSDQLAAYKQLHTYADSTAIISNIANAYMGVTYRMLRD